MLKHNTQDPGSQLPVPYPGGSTGLPQRNATEASLVVRKATNQSHARLAQSVERETLTSTRSQGCGFDPRIGLFL